MATCFQSVLTCSDNEANVLTHVIFHVIFLHELNILHFQDVQQSCISRMFST
jgi:hypothetical protein